jgi:poly(3-hydroxybutyrate) depolymerase
MDNAHDLAIRRSTMIVRILLVIAIGTITAAFAQAPAGWEARTSGAIPYQLFKPANYDTAKRYPLVTVFHGAGGRGTANDRYNEQECKALTLDSNKTKRPCFIIAPQCPTTGQWVNVPFNQGTYSTTLIPISDQLKDVYNAILAVSNEFPVDKKRLYLMGGSMGAYAQWDLLTRYPSTFSAAVPVSGGADTAKAAQILNVAIHAAHSDNDNVVPFTGTRNMITALTKHGGTPLFDSLHNMGHVWSFNTVDSFCISHTGQSIIPWLFLQSLHTTSAAPGRKQVVQGTGSMPATMRCVLVDSRQLNVAFVANSRYDIVACDGKLIARCNGAELNSFFTSAPRGVYLVKDRNEKDLLHTTSGWIITPRK